MVTCIRKLDSVQELDRIRPTPLASRLALRCVALRSRLESRLVLPLWRCVAMRSRSKAHFLFFECSLNQWATASSGRAQGSESRLTQCSVSRASTETLPEKEALPENETLPENSAVRTRVPLTRPSRKLRLSSGVRIVRWRWFRNF